MIEVRQSITVARPAAELFDYWGDHANNTEWQTGQKRCEWTSDGPIRIGSTYEQEAEFLGRPVISRFEVVEFTPGVSIRIVTTESTMPLDITRTVTANDDGSTTLSAVIRGGPGGVMRLFDPLTRRMVQRTTDADDLRLQSNLDGRP